MTVAKNGRPTPDPASTMKRLISWHGNQLHCPADSRAAIASAWVHGADAVVVRVWHTSDGVPVTADMKVVAALGHPAIATRTLAAWREVNLRKGFTNASGTPMSWPAIIDPLEAVLASSPVECPLILHCEEGVAEILALVIRVRPGGETWIASTEPALLEGCPLPTALILAAGATLPGTGRAALAAIFAPAGDLLANGKPTPLLRALAGTPVYAVYTDAPSPEAIAALSGVAGVATPSTLLSTSAPPPWIAEDFPGKDINIARWSFGYAKASWAAHVYQEDALHIDILPYTGEVDPKSTDPLEARLLALQARTWDAMRDWPFYAGGGACLNYGITGAFRLEVDVESAAAQQATTVEMAVVNVDPGAHQPPYTPDGKPKRPRSFRDKDTCFDPHGCPPFVGVEHDEDDGWRINWNLGTEYDSNQYGRPAGSGKLLRGVMRLERRGAWFSAWFRPAGNTVEADWICVGTTRNESMNDTVFVRCAGKRWRQEDPANPDVYLPVIPNHFTFRAFRLTRIAAQPPRSSRD